MSSENTIFIYNNIANRGRGVADKAELCTLVKSKFPDAGWYEPNSIPELLILIREKISAGLQQLIVCGGDGTINKVIAPLLGTEVALGILPIGSGNDFSKSVGMPFDCVKCLEVLAQGKRRKVDVLQFRGDVSGYGINTLGFGLDGWTNHFAQRSWFSGSTSYTAGALRAIYAFRGTDITVWADQEKFTKPLLMLTACNGKVEGGDFRIAPDADISDGSIDLVLVDQLPIYKVIPKLFKLKKGETDLPEITRMKVKRIRFESRQPSALHCDGEQLGISIRQLDISILPSAISVLIP